MKTYSNQPRLLFILFFLALWATNFSYSQSFTKEELKDSINQLPYFSIHKNNFFIAGVPTNEAINSSTADAKYQISFKQVLTRSRLPWDTYLYLTYTQKAFWNVFEDSFPFRDLNFNPSLAVGKMFYDKNNRLKGMGTLALEHESNGRDSIFSRSWNRLSAEYTTSVNKKTIASVKLWLPFMYKEGNPDLLEYVGLGEINVVHTWKPDKLMFDLKLQKGLNLEAKGSIRTRVYFNPFNNNISNQYIMLEWYLGQAEGLLNYQESQSMIRIGYVIKSDEFRWLSGK